MTKCHLRQDWNYIFEFISLKQIWQSVVFVAGPNIILIRWENLLSLKFVGSLACWLCLWLAMAMAASRSRLFTGTTNSPSLISRLLLIITTTRQSKLCKFCNLTNLVILASLVWSWEHDIYWHKCSKSTYTGITADVGDVDKQRRKCEDSARILETEFAIMITRRMILQMKNSSWL